MLSVSAIGWASCSPASGTVGFHHCQHRLTVRQLRCPGWTPGTVDEDKNCSLGALVSLAVECLAYAFRWPPCSIIQIEWAQLLQKRDSLVQYGFLASILPPFWISCVMAMHTYTKHTMFTQYIHALTDTRDHLLWASLCNVFPSS